MHNKQLGIFLIDDDPINIFTIEKLIKKCNANALVKSFDSGKKALAYFENLDEQDYPDIILLDLYMPQMDGWQFLDAYQEQGFKKSSCTIYILSSSVDERDAVLAEEHGLIQEFLKKPLGKDKLTDLLSYHQEFINRH